MKRTDALGVKGRRKTETEMGGLCKERFGVSGRGGESDSEGWGVESDSEGWGVESDSEEWGSGE